MPDTYQNPSNMPPVGPFQWVPSGIPTGGAVPNSGAWATLVINRGKFRNDLPKTEEYPNSSVEILVTGEAVSGSKDDPILAAFRYIARPSSVRGPTPSTPFVLKGDESGDWSYSAILTTKFQLSATTIIYSLVVDLTDETLWPYLSDEDAAKAKAYKPGGDVPQIDWSQYKFGKVLTIGSSGEEVEWPTFVDNKPQELIVTGPLIEGSTPEGREATIRFGADSAINPADFPTLSGIKIVPRDKIKSMQLHISKMMLFNAERVNIRSEQLPAALLEYAVSLQFNYDPAINDRYFPTSGSIPNTHIKLFVPDYLSGSPGFAHSLNFRFLIISNRISGIDPTGANNLYFVIFTGPAPGSRTVAYSLTSDTLITPSLRVVLMDNDGFQEGVKSLKLQKSKAPGDSLPEPAAAWTDLEDSEYTISSPPGFDYLGIDGPFVRDFMYLDKTGTTKDWYRIIQILSDNSEFFGNPFRNDVYYERSSLKMSGAELAADLTGNYVIARRDILESSKPVMNLEPLVVFEDFAEDRFYSSPININKGPWKLRLRAYSPDPEAYVNSFLFARFWFVPEDYTHDPITPHKHRDETEFYFNSDSNGKTTFVRGTPSLLEHVMVLPPLPNNASPLEAVRYIDSISGSGTSTSGFSLPASFGGKRAKLMIGIYALASLDAEGTRLNINQTDIRLPRFTVALDNAYNAIETSIYQTLSYAYFPTKANIYDSSNYAGVDLPLTASKSLVGGGSIGEDYAPYSKTFRATDDPSESAFNGLCTLGNDPQQEVKVCMPFETIPNQYDPGVYVTADFVTNSKTLAQGRVLTGDWEMEMSLNAAEDTPTVACDFKFEAMLVTRDGKVSERVFRSGIIKGITQSGSIKLERAITFPFLINGEDTQFVLRVYAYPYARNTPVEIDALKTLLGDTPLGARIDGITIANHTMQRLNFVQVDSKPGSPAWYEDLPLTPTKSLESNEFWFIVSSEALTTQVVAGGIGLIINGTVYGPAWYVDLPKNVEVDLATGAFDRETFWVRTVLGEGGSAERGLSAIEDERSGTVHVVYDEPAADGAIDGLTGAQIRHYMFDTPYQSPSTNTVIKGIKGSEPKTMEGRDPSLVYVRRDQTNESGDFVGVMAQVDGTSEKSYNMALNPYESTDTWIGPNHNISDRNFGEIRRVAQGLTKPAIFMSDNGVGAYVTGYLSDGSTLVMREVNLYDAGVEGNLAQGIVYVVDGDPGAQITTGETLVLPYGTLNGKVVDTFASGAVTPSGQLVVAYALQGESGVLHARFRNAGQAFSPAVPIIDMHRFGITVSSDLAIYSPSIAVHRSTNSMYVAFWCGGRILISRIQGFTNSEAGVMLSPLQLVAGSRDFKQSGSANGAFALMESNGSLLVSPFGTDESNVPQQRVGIFVSEKAPYQGNVFVYYKNADNKLRARQVRPDATVGAPIVIE